MKAVLNCCNLKKKKLQQENSALTTPQQNLVFKKIFAEIIQPLSPFSGSFIALFGSLCDKTAYKC